MVFFDDIFICNKNKGIRLQHVRIVLSILRKHQLFAKSYKCSFEKLQVEYLGHVIDQKIVSVSASKIKAIKEWPTPKSVKALRRFLGFTWYYRKFVRNYGVIAKPLTTFLQKEQFLWSEEAYITFEKLKKALTETPVLHRPISRKHL